MGDGTINKINKYQYISKGKYNIVNYKTVEVTELPIGTWTEDYKDFLETLLVDYEKKSKKKDGSRTNKKNKCYLKNYQNHSTESKAHFILEFKPDVLKKLNFSKENKDNHYSKLEKELKLVSTISTSNMCLFDNKCVIHKYENANEIIKEFYNVRLQTYENRKKYMLAKMENDIEILKQKMMFILGIIDEEIIINKRSKDNITQQLVNKQFKKMDSSNTFNEDGNYNYLISMPIYSLTLEKKIELEKDYNEKQKEYDELFTKTEKNIWLEELDEFEKIYKSFLKEK